MAIVKKARLHCEFLYRNAKQHTGLTQIHRSQQRLRYYPNQEVPQEAPSPWLTLKHNTTNKLLPDRFIIVFGIVPKRQPNSRKTPQLYKMGKIAAYICTEICKISTRI